MAGSITDTGAALERDGAGAAAGGRAARGQRAAAAGAADAGAAGAGAPDAARQQASATGTARHDSPPPAPGGAPSSAGRTGTPGLALAALALSVVAIVTVFVFWRQQSQLLQDLGSAREAAGAARADVASTATTLERRLEERLSGQEARLRDLEPVVGTLAQRVEDLRDAQTRTEERLAAQDDRLDAAAQGVARNEQALADAGGVLRDARDRWVLAEAEYLLQTANTALQLARDPRTALAALEAADDHLGTLANPQLTRTRETLAAEITALRAMPAPDVDGIAVRLASLAATADSLPLVEDRVRNYPLEGGDPDAPPGWERAWSALKGAVSSLVSFRRDDAEVVPLLEPDERFFLHRNLELQITAARVAALDGDDVNYRLSLEAARRTLNAGFDGDTSAVRSMREQLEELMAIDIAPDRPDISGSLLALREAAARLR